VTETQARQYLATNRRGVLATIKRDGRPQLSKVLYFLDDDGRCKISVTQTRAKTHNLRRDPRATLMAMSDQWYSYVVVEGTTEFIEGPGVLDELVRYYRRVAGEHPNWDEYREAMVKDQRLLLSISVDRLIY
jgi:PPOX class probable F420-dependent enzyme